MFSCHSAVVKSTSHSLWSEHFTNFLLDAHSMKSKMKYSSSTVSFITSLLAFASDRRVQEKITIFTIIMI